MCEQTHGEEGAKGCPSNSAQNAREMVTWWALNFVLCEARWRQQEGSQVMAGPAAWRPCFGMRVSECEPTLISRK